MSDDERWWFTCYTRRMLPRIALTLGDVAGIGPEVIASAWRDAPLFPTPEGDCALLLDASAQETQQRLMQQKGNELSLSYQRMVKEIQKKEILLHCIVHDLAGPLMGIRGGFELLAGENISDRGRKFLEIGLRQTAKQDALIREILQAFSAISENRFNSAVTTQCVPQTKVMWRAVSSCDVRQRIGVSGRSRATRRPVEPEVV